MLAIAFECAGRIVHGVLVKPLKRCGGVKELDVCYCVMCRDSDTRSELLHSTSERILFGSSVAYIGICVL